MERIFKLFRSFVVVNYCQPPAAGGAGLPTNDWCVTLEHYSACTGANIVMNSQ